MSVSDPSDPRIWHVDALSITEFALTMLAMNAKFSAADLWRADGQATNDAVLSLEENLTRLPLPDLYWPSFPTRFYGYGRTVVEIDGFTWIWVTARDADAFATITRLAGDAGVQWENIGNPGP